MRNSSSKVVCDCEVQVQLSDAVEAVLRLLR